MLSRTNANHTILYSGRTKSDHSDDPDPKGPDHFYHIRKPSVQASLCQSTPEPEHRTSDQLQATTLTSTDPCEAVRS
jgi:hypothetical protein